MTVREIMSSPVISVLPAQPIAEIAVLLRDRRIGGLPVILDGKLQGIVTASDLIRRCEIGTDAIPDPRPWWRRMQQGDAAARAYVKSHGRTAHHVMTRHVHVLDPSAQLADVVSMFESQHVGRAPVTLNERVIGMIARADLVKALAEQPMSTTRASAVQDDGIRRMLADELASQPWWNGRWETFYVDAGVVIFKGVVENRANRAATRVAAENIPGVRGVLDDRILSAEVHEII
ncbi:MAG: histidine kinase [Ramlibacter sp.]|nr:histidine kinase [Ramlibacter sp.]